MEMIKILSHPGIHDVFVSDSIDGFKHANSKKQEEFQKWNNIFLEAKELSKKQKMNQEVPELLNKIKIETLNNPLPSSDSRTNWKLI